MDASRDQQQRQHEQDHAERELPRPPIRVEVEIHERPDAEVEQRTYRNSTRSAQWVTAYATSAAFLAAAIYAALAACQLKTTNRTYGEIERQTTLMRQQLVGTLSAVVTVQSPGLVRDEAYQWATQINLFNQGHAVSPNARLSFQLFTASFPALAPIEQSPLYQVTIPQLDKSWSSEKYTLFGFTDQDIKYVTQRRTFSIKGTLTFNNGFGDTFQQPLCWDWVGQYRLKYPDGSIVNGGGFVDCDLFKTLLDEIAKQPQG